MATNPITMYGSNSVGNPQDTRVWREDVYSALTDISPSETAVLNGLPQDTCTDTTVKWVVKKLNPTKTTLDTAVEGVEWSAFTTPTYVKRPILENYCEKFAFPVMVSDDVREVDMYGGNDEFYLKTAEAVKEMGRNIEIRFFDDVFANTNAASANANFVAAGASTTLRMKPLMQLIFQGRGSTGINFAPTQGSGINAFRSTDMARVDRATGASLIDETGAGILDTTTYPLWAQTRWTETMATKFQEVVRGNKDTGGCNVDTFVVPPANWGQTGAFGIGPGTGAGYGDLSVNIEASMRTISRAVHYYRSNYGLVRVIESRWLDQAKNTGAGTTLTLGGNPRDAARNCGLVWGFERKFLQVVWFRKPVVDKMARTGLNEKAIVHSQLTLRLLHPQAAGVIIGVNNV